MIDEYWALDIPGLDENGALRLADVARGLEGVVAVAVLDPRTTFSVHLSQEAATILARMLGGLPPSEDASPEEKDFTASLREDIQEWLAWAPLDDGSDDIE